MSSAGGPRRAGPVGIWNLQRGNAGHPWEPQGVWRCEIMGWSLQVVPRRPGAPLSLCPPLGGPLVGSVSVSVPANPSSSHSAGKGAPVCCWPGSGQSLGQADGRPERTHRQNINMMWFRPCLRPSPCAMGSPSWVSLLFFSSPSALSSQGRCRPTQLAAWPQGCGPSPAAGAAAASGLCVSVPTPTWMGTHTWASLVSVGTRRATC